MQPRFFPYLHVFVAGCCVVPFSPGLWRDAGLYFFVAGGPAFALSLALAAPELRRTPARCAGFAVSSIALYEAAVYGVLRAEHEGASLLFATAAISGPAAALFLALYCAWLGRKDRALRSLVGIPLGALASPVLHPVAGEPGGVGSGTVAFVLAWYAGVALAIGLFGLGPAVETRSEGRP